MLLATLPSPHNKGLVEEIFSSPLVEGARYNIGTRSGYSPEETLHRLNRVAEKHGKKFYVDLKGRQLRITKWADPTYGDIELNREVSIKLPAKVRFRGDDKYYDLDSYTGNKLYIYPDPIHALGAGQALNIIGDNLEITGNYLNPSDILYTRAARDIGIHDYMLSFVEKQSDISELKSFDPDAKPVLKIESQKGLEFVSGGYDGKNQLMAARDDLYVNLENDNGKIQSALKLIIEKDPEAIAASRIFQSLKSQPPSSDNWITCDDVEDMRNLHNIGYHNFMFDDTISHRYFKEAVGFWKWWCI